LGFGNLSACSQKGNNFSIFSVYPTSLEFFIYLFFSHLHANPRLWFFAYVVVAPKNLFPLSTKQLGNFWRNVFSRVNSNFFSNYLGKLANFLISLKLEFKILKKSPVAYSFYEKKN